MICPRCGHENRTDARFCARCGAVVGPPSRTQPEDIALPEATTSPQPEPVAAPEPGPEPMPDPVSGLPVEPEPEPAPEPAMHPEPEADQDVEPADEPMAATPEPEPSAGEVLPREDTPSPGVDSPGGDSSPPEGGVSMEDEVLLFTADEPALPEPLAPGSVIGERYAVTEVLEVYADRVHYRGLDLVRCPVCGSQESAPDDAFCATCGADRTRKVRREIVELHGVTEEAVPEQAEWEGNIEAHWLENERLYLVLAPTEEMPVEPRPGLRFVVGQRSDPGLVRELDEDSLLAVTVNLTCEGCTGLAVGLFAVADGMGGHAGGEVASRIALQVLGEEVLRRLVMVELTHEPQAPPSEGMPSWDEEAVLHHLREAVMAANDQVYLERHRRNNDMGTTLTAAFVRDSRLLIAHVGDCRAYRWDAKGLTQLTTDHSIVASLAEAGQIEPDAIYTHPQRSVIYRCIGDEAQVEVDTVATSIEAGDRLVLCCDGLWEMVRSAGIEEVMLREADPQAACDQLVRYANQAGGDDNISVIVVQVEAV